MAAHFAISPQEDDIVIKHRLLTRTTVTRGEPPLKKLVKRFSAFVAELEKEGDGLADVERVAKAFLQEINSFELPLIKTRAVIEANLREQENFITLQSDLDRQIDEVREEIEAHKAELEHAQVERKHKEECEVIRRLIAAEASRAETERAIQQLQREISVLEGENTAAARTLDLRKKQFALLMHAVEDLENAIDGEGRSVTAGEHAEDLRGRSGDGPWMAREGGESAEPMVVDGS